MRVLKVSVVRSIGFTSQDHSTDGMEAINRMFTPEFRNRLDSDCAVRSAGRGRYPDRGATSSSLSCKVQLDEKRVTIDVDEDARLWLVEKGLRQKHGRAGPWSESFRRYIKKPLAEMVLFGGLAQSGGTAMVRLNKTEHKLDVVMEDGRVGSGRELAEPFLIR